MTENVRVTRILVPIDGSGPSHTAVRLASEIGRALGSEMTLLYVGPLSENPLLLAESETAEEAARGQGVLSAALVLAKEGGMDARLALVHGRPAEQILRYARKYRPQLIVMGTRGLSQARSVFLGSVSGTVSREAECSVVLAR